MGGIRTIVDLCREKRGTVEALQERAFARAEGIRHVPIMVPGGMVGAEAEEDIRRFLDVLDDQANRPVLVHCWKGVKRTGVMVAIAKMEYLGIDNAQAVAGLDYWGRTPEDFDATERGCVEKYVPRKRRAGAEPAGGGAPAGQGGPSPR